MEMASMVTIGEVVKLKEKPKSARYYDKETRAKLIRRVGELAAMGMGEDDFYSSLLADGFKAPNGEKLKRTTVIHMLYRAKRALGTSRTYRNRRKPQESAHSAPRERIATVASHKKARTRHLANGVLAACPSSS
jgi:hypothetical protein